MIVRDYPQSLVHMEDFTMRGMMAASEAIGEPKCKQFFIYVPYHSVIREEAMRAVLKVCYE